MAKIYGNNNADVGGNPPGNSSPMQEAKKKTVSNVFDLSKQAVVTTADQLVVGRAQKGWAFRGGQVLVDTSLGTSTIAIGTAAAVAKYKAAATAATINTPVVTGAVVAGAWDALLADEELIITVAVAPLPAAGKIYVDLDFLTA